jgi:SAM-dependent methyltransferase
MRGLESDLWNLEFGIWSPGKHDEWMKRHAPAAARNREPILHVLERVLPADGMILEVGSGSGEHAVFAAPRLSGRTWQPTDVDPDALLSIEAWRNELPAENLLIPQRLDVRQRPWPFRDLAAVVSINVIHISPWGVCEALVEGAADALRPEGVLFFYGPFKIDGRHSAPSNEAFDASLRSRDPAWGVRDLADVRRLAEKHGLKERDLVPMPANNFSVVFERLVR